MVDISSGDMGGFESMLGGMELDPAAGISGDSEGYVNVPLNLSADRSYDPDGPIIEYDWDCDSDGNWDIIGATIPNTTCTYTAPYNGLVTLRVLPENGSPALATFSVAVSAGSPPPQATPPEKPNVHLTYTTSSVKLTWQNTYDSDTYIQVADSDDNLLGYAPASAVNIQLAGIGDEVPALHISACNTAGCSESVSLDLDQASLDALVSSDDAPSFAVDDPGTLSNAITSPTAHSNSVFTNGIVLASFTSLASTNSPLHNFFSSPWQTT
jgi:hypothetical protein